MPYFKIKGVGPTAGERCDRQQLLSALTLLLSTNKRVAGELHAANPTGTDAELAQRGRTGRDREALQTRRTVVLLRTAITEDPERASAFGFLSEYVMTLWLVEALSYQLT
ncbi:hypothetical protein AOLI_G00101750 [Acnodon oligacanthus]